LYFEEIKNCNLESFFWVGELQKQYDTKKCKNNIKIDKQIDNTGEIVSCKTRKLCDKQMYHWYWFEKKTNWILKNLEPHTHATCFSATIQKMAHI